MKYLLRSGLVLGLVLLACACKADTGTITIDFDKPIGAISPYIYGSNHDIDGFKFNAARRLGGNRLTGYNWEIDASHAGNDYRHQHDRWLAGQPFWNKNQNKTPQNSVIRPAGTILDFHRESIDRGSYSLVTVPMAGFVAADADGIVDENAVAPSNRWDRVKSVSPRDAAWSAEDGVVYVDEMVRHLTGELGPTKDKGIRGYSLDNEPGLWKQTHPRLHSKAVTCAELLTKSTATAKAIKSVDPDAEVFGPALWGMSAFASLQDADDWKSLKQQGDYAWFIDAYLDRMQQASKKSGRRLLDVLDVHWYTQDPDGRPFTGAEAALSARALYDTDHTEPNWVGKHFQRFQPLLPRLKKSIDRYYPGTKLAISEYDWPMTGQVYGGLAQADALGAFGTHGVYFAAYHHRVDTKKDQYVAAAFNLYLNYDGKRSAFGDTALPIDIDSEHEITAYAASSNEGALHLILLNIEETDQASLRLDLPKRLDVSSAKAWAFDASSPAVTSREALTHQPDGLSIKLAPLSATHIVIPKRP